MRLKRRTLLGSLALGPLTAMQGSADTARPALAFDGPSAGPLGCFEAGQPSALELSRFIVNFKPGLTQLRLRADLGLGGDGERSNEVLPLSGQYPEFSLHGSQLRYDGSGAGAVAAGPSSIRLRVEAFDGGPGSAPGVVLSPMAQIHVNAPPARIRHGLDAWASFDELTAAVQGSAAPGSWPRGRTDLIGATFLITPGMFSEGYDGRGQRRDGAGPAAVVQFPCTLQAQDIRHRPVFRGVSGLRDVLQIHARRLPPIDGDVVLRDLVIRDNRGWIDTGEGGVRIKDRFAGRSVHIERCEFIRCQNAVAGGVPGQRLRIADCRIVDCGFGGKAHGCYLQPGWLEFSGNVIGYSAGNRFARGHLLKTRALNANIFGNRFMTNDCALSYLIDIANGGRYDIGGNQFHYGSRSDNTHATLIAFAPEGAAGDFGPAPQVFSPGRSFGLTVRNNTFLSSFDGPTRMVVVDGHLGQRHEGGIASTWPEPLLVQDNLHASQGPGALLVLRDRSSASQRETAGAWGRPEVHRPTEPDSAGGRVDTPNTAGTYSARRFTGSSYLGTGSAEHLYRTQGA